MDKGQFAILRFAKYKGTEIGNIEAHNERTKEKYASNPDVDLSRSRDNFHIVQPTDKYRAMAEALIKQYGCPRVRSDSVRIVETLITASPEFFQGRKKSEVKDFFLHAAEFLKQELGEDRILSAVVHMDEKTPHMHVSFTPITKDGRLSAKLILGNRKTLTAWQDRYWKHMVSKFPELERGESAGKTGREHIPPRVFKEARHLDRQMDRLLSALDEINAFNAKSKADEVGKLLKRLAPQMEDFFTQTRKYESAIQSLAGEKGTLTQTVASLQEKLKTASTESVKKRLADAAGRVELEDLQRRVSRYAPELLKPDRISQERASQIE